MKSTNSIVFLSFRLFFYVTKNLRFLIKLSSNCFKSSVFFKRKNNEFNVCNRNLVFRKFENSRKSWKYRHIWNFKLTFIAKLPGSLLSPRCQSNDLSFSWTSMFQKQWLWPIYRNTGCPNSPNMLDLITCLDFQSLMSQESHLWFLLTRSHSKVW